ncbi:hypothetical protein KCV03_g155, partial [Aureobasidium melanogenum]
MTTRPSSALTAKLRRISSNSRLLADDRPWTRTSNSFSSLRCASCSFSKVINDSAEIRATTILGIVLAHQGMHWDV